MNEIVFRGTNDQALTNSLLIAENLVRSIRMLCSLSETLLVGLLKIQPSRKCSQNQGI